MLQTRPTRDDDRAVPYLRAGSLERLSEFDSFPTMYASQRETEVYAVRRGDLLVAEGGDVGRTEFARDLPDQTIIQNSLHIIRADLGDIRFIRYCLEALRACGWIDVLCNRATFGHLTVEKLRSLEIPWPTKTHQEAIADFLDSETARIDALIAKKRRMMEAFSARLAGLVELQVRAMAEEYGEVPLRFTVPEVTVGIVVTPARWYSAEGVPAIRGVNVRPGRIDMGDLVYLTAEGNALHEKSVLREGDLVVVRTGQAGSAAVVPKELDGANCIDVLLIRRSAALLPRYLEYVINSDWTRKHIEAHSVGTIQSHFNVGALRELRIPVPESTVQEAVVRRLDKDSERVESLTSALERQIGLLAERRQALITAAVTGELDVPESIAEAAS